MASFRYWRLYVSKWVMDGSTRTTTGDVRVSELQLFTAAAVKWPTSVMTGASAPSPFVASASGDDGSNLAFMAFDNDTSNGSRWISNANPGGPVWLKIDLGSAVDIVSFKIAPDSAAGLTVAPCLFVDFQLQGSSTGSFTGEQTVFASYVGLYEGWATSTLRTFTPLHVTGTVLDDTGAAAQRTVRAYDRTTGAFIAETTSDPSTGAYSIQANSSSQIIALDDVAGTVYNDLISRATGT